MTPHEVLAYAKENGSKMVDLKFMDFPGLWQHFSVPIAELKESSFEEGYGFDGSSIRGWKAIHASDMLVVPDPSTRAYADRLDDFSHEDLSVADTAGLSRGHNGLDHCFDQIVGDDNLQLDFGQEIDNVLGAAV